MARRVEVITASIPDLINLIAKWVDVAGGVVSMADVHHSALLYRLLSGRPLLPDPPPKAYSYPWYKLAEGEKCRAEQVYDVELEDISSVSVEQHLGWSWEDDTKSVLVYENVRYRWEPDPDSKHAGWLQKIKRYEVAGVASVPILLTCGGGVAR